jgi:hypothetical protein
MQPRRGDLVLACPHLGAPRTKLHWYGTGGATLAAPDGRHVTPRFMVACEGCLRRARNNPRRVAYNEIIWQSNSAVIDAPPPAVPSDITI